MRGILLLQSGGDYGGLTLGYRIFFTAEWVLHGWQKMGGSLLCPEAEVIEGSGGSKSPGYSA
jgi:uncharacterized membrane protein YphA (DoxX/SURF4 family)